MNKEFEQNINELNFISKKIEKDNPKQSSFGGAATGALIGSAIAPGIGTFLGGAIGKWLTDANNESKDGLQPFNGLEEDTKHEIRENYQISRNEKILFVSTEENERVVITENQLIWDDSTEKGPFYHILWANIKKVYYQEGQFIVQTLDKTEGSIPAGFFWGIWSLVEMEKLIGSNNRIASILTNAANCVNKPEETPLMSLENKILTAKTAGEAQSLAEKYLSEGGVESRYQRIKAFLFWKQLNEYLEKNLDKQLLAMPESERIKLMPQLLEETHQTQQAKNYLKVLENTNWDDYSGSKWEELGEMYVLLKYLYDCSNSTRKLAYAMKEGNENLWKDFSKKYNENFIKLPYKERKLIVPMEELPAELPDSFCALNINDMPNITFPFGHPQPDKIYIGHPLRPNFYLPMEHYQLELLDDQLRELCEVVQALGATNIDTQVCNISTTNRTASKEMQAKINGSFMTFNAGASGSRAQHREELVSLTHRLEIHQEFTPTNKPYVPEDLVWFKHTDSWQRVARQRMKGGLVLHSEILSTNNINQINSQEEQALSIDFSEIYGLEGDGKRKFEESLKQDNDIEVKFFCKFKPLEQLPQE